MTACSMTGQFDHDRSCGWQRRILPSDRCERQQAAPALDDAETLRYAGIAGSGSWIGPAKCLDDVLDEPAIRGLHPSGRDPLGGIAIQ